MILCLDCSTLSFKYDVIKNVDIEIMHVSYGENGYIVTEYEKNDTGHAIVTCLKCKSFNVKHYMYMKHQLILELREILKVKDAVKLNDVKIQQVVRVYEILSKFEKVGDTNVYVQQM